MHILTEEERDILRPEKKTYLFSWLVFLAVSHKHEKKIFSHKKKCISTYHGWNIFVHWTWIRKFELSAYFFLLTFPQKLSSSQRLVLVFGESFLIFLCVFCCFGDETDQWNHGAARFGVLPVVGAENVLKKKDLRTEKTRACSVLGPFFSRCCLSHWEQPIRIFQEKKKLVVAFFSHCE